MEKIYPKNKVLLFRNIFNFSGNSENQELSLATLYLASGLKKEGFEVILSSFQIPFSGNKFVGKREELTKILKANPEINFIGLTLPEAFFGQIKTLIKFLRKNTKAFIGVGGTMPTSAPNHVLAH